MDNYLLQCKTCKNNFFTQSERDFYHKKNFVEPKLCKSCRNKRQSTVSQNGLYNEIIENWNIEAKQENSNYFYNTSEAQELLNGRKHFVVGRKGTGKTAIAEYISNIEEFNVFSEKLSFKNFPFNYLYSLENNNYTAPNQYISIWKYLIYSCVCKMMTKNNNINSEIADKLKEIYSINSKESLSRMVEKWTATDFGVEVLGVSLTGTRENIPAAEMNWIDKCNILEDIIVKYLDDSKYFIIIDELDEDYREFESNAERKTYLHLLTSLFKATQDVRAILKNNKSLVYPIVFLRTDIYSLIKDSDRNKWNSYKIDLDWTTEKIKNMLAHRISIASSKPALEFNQAWNLLFTAQSVQMGNRNHNHMNKFDYIARSTQLRPRDFIHYIIECSKEAYKNNEDKISSAIVKAVDDSFSEYLRDEIIDEAHSVLPEINEIFEILSQVRKQTFSPKEFSAMYSSYVEANRISEQNAENVLRMLFEFSVIGNQPSAHSQAIFKYQTVRARFNYRENIMIHRGLYKALQIF